MLINNYTQVSNEFIEYMPNLSGSAVKVGLAIFRSTIGWHIRSKKLPYKDLKEMTGLSTNSLKKGIEELENKFISKIDTENGYEYDLAISKIDTEGCQKLTPSVSKIDTIQPSLPILVKKDIKKRKKAFSPPSLEEIKKYISEKSLSVNAKYFYDFFTEGNWIDSKGNKVKSWKQKLLTWDKYQASHNKKTSQNHGAHPNQVFDGTTL